MSNLQVEASQSTNNIPITLTPKQQPTLLLTPDKVWGTKDYENLENKPSLNGRELTKGMTLADFNLHPDKVEKNEEDIININEYLKELTPKNTAEGESSLYIKDALELPIFEMSIEGNSYQQQTTGKQLYNVYDTVTVSEKATVDSDGWITISENNTTQPVIYHNYYTNNLNLVGGKEYAIILEVKKVEGTGRIILTSNHTYEDGTRVAGQFEDSIYLGFSSLASNSKKVFLKTTIEDPTQVMNGLRTYLEFQNGNSGSITFRISVLEDTSITPETFIYEKYTGEIAGPNPDYPSDIQSFEPYNLLKITTFTDETTEQTKNGITVKINSDGTITCKGVATEKAIFEVKKHDLDFSLGDGYFICNSPSSTKRVEFKCTVDGAVKYLNSYGAANYIQVKNSFEFNMVYIVIEKNEEINYTFNPMFIKGTKLKPYLPYGTVGLKISNKNLAKATKKSFTASGVTFIQNEDGTYTLNGTCQYAVDNNLLAFGTDIIPIKKNQYYKLSFFHISGEKTNTNASANVRFVTESGHQ